MSDAEFSLTHREVDDKSLFKVMKLLLSFLILAALLVLVESAVFTATDELEALADNQKLLIKELIAIKEKFKIPSDHYVSR